MYPYTQNVGTLIAVIKAIGKNGVPTSFTTKELPVWGFKSSNDRSVVGVLKFIGFIDGSNAPTALWKEARAHPEVAVGKGTKSGYGELFKTFPDAHRKDAESLTNFFKAKTVVGDAVVKQMVATFRTLASFGTFEDDASPPMEQENIKAPKLDDVGGGLLPKTTLSSGSGVTINLNIELSVPTDATGEVYEKFFQAMRKYLIDAK
jgi:hypothetical protein